MRKGATFTNFTKVSAELANIGERGEAFEYDDLRAEWVEVEGTWIHVATPETLFRMKRNTIGPIDRHDAIRLSRAFDFGRRENMSTTRFQSLDEARDALVCSPPRTREHLKTMAALWSRSFRLTPREYPKGVMKFRTIEEANVERDERCIRDMRKLRQIRGFL